jgi:hypothetical protein
MEREEKESKLEEGFARRRRHAEDGICKIRGVRLTEEMRFANDT